MKAKGLYIILSLYSLTRWFTAYFERNYSSMFDANILYFVFDGCIICCIGMFLYASSSKDYASKGSLFLMLSLGVAQSVSFINNHRYNEYIDYLPILVAGVTALEVYKSRNSMLNGIKWLINKISWFKK